MSDAGIKPLVGNLGNPGDYLRAASECEVLIHAGFEGGPAGPPLDRLAVETLGKAAQVGQGRKIFIYTSGVWVLGPWFGKEADENSRPNPLPLVSWRPENEWMAADVGKGAVATVIVRPGCVYGGKGGLYGEMIRSALERKLISVIGDGLNCWANVHRDDLADLYCLIAEKRPPSGIYHATDESAEPVKKIAEAFLEAAGGGKLEHETPESARARLGPFAETLALNQRVSSGKARRELGWKPRYDCAAKHALILIKQWKTGEAP